MTHCKDVAFSPAHLIPLPSDLGGGPAVVVVEDQDMERFYLRLLIEKIVPGARVVEVTHGDQAWETIRKEKPALVVLDLLLPGPDGLKICRDVRRTEGLSATRILAITAGAPGVTREDAIGAGADAFLPKPFSPEDFQEEATLLLRASRRR